MILDTDILIDYFKEKSYAVEKIEKLQEEQVSLSTTSVNSFELFKGALRSSNKNKVDSLRFFLNTLKILDFTLKSSEKAAEIFEYLKNKGEMLDLADVMIASIVITNNEIFLTRNKKHFNRIPDLKIEEL